MRLPEVRGLALRLMKEHGLLETKTELNRFTGATVLRPAWSFTFDNSRLRFGACFYRTKVISVSKHLAELNEEAEIRDTLLHEIAHALTPGAKHGPAWRMKVLAIGGRAERCYSSKDVVTPDAPWKAACARCEKTFNRFACPRRPLYCRCWRAARVQMGTWVPLAWFKGVLVRPNPRPLMALPVAALSATPPSAPPVVMVPRRPAVAVTPDIESRVADLRHLGLSHRKIEKALGIEGQNGFWAMKVLRKLGLR